MPSMLSLALAVRDGCHSIYWALSALPEWLVVSGLLERQLLRSSYASVSKAS
ncbi:hypothetical protein SCARR_05313 [Pontiella sulfatireligans]|uniref:Uncharacterized protein n=1 Tax=Pontiella sulfatireligans TaxID=2750658 RepID=A0A6C2UWI4_9BACT|nr:hypothetical protein SCARR_05313 [Pontiella sulfatireligans]